MFPFGGTARLRARCVGEADGFPDIVREVPVPSQCGFFASKTLETFFR